MTKSPQLLDSPPSPESVAAVAVEADAAMTAGETPLPAGAHSANASSASLLRNVVTSYIATASSMAVAFFVTPILIRKLGAEEFGVWTLLLATVAYLGLFDLGIGTAVAKRVADCHATHDHRRLGNVLGTALAIFAALSLVVMLATTVALPHVQHLLKLSPGFIFGARIALVLLALNQSITFIYNVQSSILYGAGRLDLLTHASVVGNTLSAAVNILLVLRGSGVVALATVMVCTTIFLTLVTFWLIGRYFPKTAIEYRRASWSMTRELLLAGTRNATVSLSSAVGFGADAFIIAQFMNVSSVTQYAIASKLTNVIKTIANKPVGMLLPAYSHCETLGDHERQLRLFTRGVTLSLGLSLPVAMYVFVFGDRIIETWAGAGHRDSYLPLVALTAAMLFQLQGSASFTLITATERNHLLMKLTSTSAAANLALSILFTKWLGVVGPALGTLVCVSVVDGFLIPRDACRQIGCSAGEYFRLSISQLLLPTAIAAAVAALARLLVPPGPFWTIGSGAVIGLAFLGTWSPSLFVGEGPLRKRLQDLVCFA